MKGWIKLHRQLLKSHVWANSSPEQKSILITLLMMANHADGSAEINGEVINLQPGQMITSLQNIAENAGKGISLQNVRTALKRFKKLEFLTHKPTRHYSLITICKYASYQHEKKGANTGANRKLTTNKNDKEIIKGGLGFSALNRFN